MTSLPLAAFAPAHPPEAVQPVALLALQVSVVLPPETTLVGAALSVTTGMGMVPGGGVPPPPASLPQAESRASTKPAQARPGMLRRIKPYTGARAGTGVGWCLQTAP